MDTRSTHEKPRYDPEALESAHRDFRALAARADLVYDRPVGRSEEGMPIGTGRMRSLVWTTPTASGAGRGAWSGEP